MIILIVSSIALMSVICYGVAEWNKTRRERSWAEQYVNERIQSEREAN